MNGKKPSRQMGQLIGRLIGVAREVQHLEDGEGEPIVQHTLTPQQSSKVLIETINAQASQISQLKQQIIEVRRQKLANFSIEDIAKELDRRKAQAFKVAAKSRRSKIGT